MFLFFVALAVFAVWMYTLAISSRLQSAREEHDSESNSLRQQMQGLVQRIWVLEQAA
jgi:hypothetical protein